MIAPTATDVRTRALTCGNLASLGFRGFTSAFQSLSHYAALGLGAPARNRCLAIQDSRIRYRESAGRHRGRNYSRR